MFGEDLHHPAVPGQVLVGVEVLPLPCLRGDLVQRVEPVGRGLVGSDDAEVPPPGGVPHDPGEQPAEHPGGFMQGVAAFVDGHGVFLKGRDRQIAQQQPAVGVRGGPEAVLALGQTGQHLRGGTAGGVEEFLGAVGAEPLFELAQMLGVVADLGQGHLMGTPGVLDG